jgi:hypothetical protein
LLAVAALAAELAVVVVLAVIGVPLWASCRAAYPVQKPDLPQCLAHIKL